MFILSLSSFFGNFWNIIIMLLVGALVGFIASIIMGSRGGLIRNIIIGILGSLVGSILGSFIPISGNIAYGSILLSIVGAILVIWIIRFLGAKR